MCRRPRPRPWWPRPWWPRPWWHPPAPVVAAPVADVAATLVALISERTGYPAEMLGLDLDIEADLGIDSIKRVEILGAFRKQFFGDASERVRAAMEQVTRLKTLREVVAGCSALLAEQGVAESPAPVAAPRSVVAAPALDAGAVSEALVAMISERTGYPAEMLGLDLDIEADLGIDSIKRVEILGAFRKQFFRRCERARARGDGADHAAEDAARGRRRLRGAAGGACRTRGRAAAAAPPPAVAVTAVPDENAIAEALVAMISERTGYPAEMLGLDLDIEADLGIDSIKRVEILGAFRKQFFGEASERVRAAMEEITRLKTLRDVVAGCHALFAAAAPAGAAVPPVTPAKTASRVADRAAPRFAIVPVREDVPSRLLRPGKGDIFLITDDEGGSAAALAARLQAAGAKPVLLQMGCGLSATGPDSHALDLTDQAVVKAFADWLAPGDRLAGIFHCLPLRDGPAFEAHDLATWRGDVAVNVKSLFNLAHAFGEALDRHPAACAVAATRLGGSFGLDLADRTRLRPALAGVPGLLKTFAQEWPHTSCKSVDFEAEASAQDIAELLLIEAARPREDVEIGFRGGSRFVMVTDRRPITTQGRPVLAPAPGAVILVTGGARGITAEIAREWSERHRPLLVLCGSSALPPAQESADTAGIEDQRLLKGALIKRARDAGQVVAPPAIEGAYRGLLKEREIRANIAALRSAAAGVEYHQVDVRDEAAFGGLIARVYATHGRIDGVIHGAGINEDKLVRDKTGDSFDRVVDTKIASSFILSRHLRPESLQFLALFTSVAGTYGNRGQSDYGAANEILSKLALHLDRKWPGRVVGISWGSVGQGRHGHAGNQAPVRGARHRGGAGRSRPLGVRRGDPVWPQGRGRAGLGHGTMGHAQAAGRHL